jgi:alpha-tubulin suppressor-like RCC1 family protein
MRHRELLFVFVLSLTACGDLLGLGDTPPAAPTDGGADATVADAMTGEAPDGGGGVGEPDAPVVVVIDGAPDGDAAQDGSVTGLPLLLALQEDFSCARLPTGALECWGGNDSAQQAVDSGSAVAVLTPHVILDHVAVLGSGCFADHECVGLDDGAVGCWGSNDNGQVGEPAGANVVTPTTVNGVSHVSAIATGRWGTCAVSGDQSTVTCWGNNGFGPAEPQTVDGVGPGISALGAGELFACAIVGDGGVLCWGSNQSGTLGVPDANAPSPSAPQGLGDVVQVAVGDLHACALLRSGQVKCWGANNLGQLGIGPDAGNATPTLVPGLDDVVQVVASCVGTCALHDGGTVSCWGWSGGVGANGLNEDTNVPKPVPSLSHVRTLAAGRMHACAVLDDGGVLCWGRDDVGQLGDGVRRSGGPEPVPAKL